MERTMSQEERIRRAEEIYENRRRQRDRGDIRVSSSTVNNGKKDYNLFKKLILQILICLIIYFSFYIVKNSNAIFSENFIGKVQEFLAYDVNFSEMYENAKQYYEQNIKQWVMALGENVDIQGENEIEKDTSNELETNEAQANEITNTTTEENSQTNSIESENQTTENGDIQTSNIVEESSVETSSGIGGGEEETGKTTLTQMEIDANEIKANYSLCVPLKGTITSRFGPREATEIVSANHAGIDIAVNTGTVFIASMEGTVTDVLGTGGYGNHVYIQKGDVVTLYAHCKTIYVSKGQEIKQGEKIGEVGATGNVTRTTFTF